MDALAADKFGSYDEVLQFQSVDLPSVVCVGDNEVLIKVAYSDLNPVDLQKLSGGGRKQAGQAIPNAPFVTGFGGSGTVQQVGSKGPQHLLGKEVVFLADPSRPGSYASQIAVDGRCVAALPLSVGLREAATLPVAGLTAFESLYKLRLVADSALLLNKDEATLDSVGLKTASKNNDNSSSQESLLVVGGSGGVGSWVITLARAFNPNLNIIATASSEDSQTWCKKLGATKVIGHYDIARTLEGGREGSVEHIICLTEPTSSLFSTLAEVVKPYGNILLVVAGASIGKLDLGFCFFKCANIFTESVFSSIRTKYQNIVPGAELKAILKLMDNQTIQAPISPQLTADGIISEKFKDALDDTKGVLSLLAGTNKSHKSRQGNLVMMINAEDVLVFLDLKTASILQIPRVDCMRQKILKRVKHQGDDDVWEEQTKTGQERDDLIKMITKNERLGIVKVTKKMITEHEEGLQLQEAENIKNLWGVSLKKRDKNKEGEELIFVDPRNETIGEIARKTFIEKGCMTIVPAKADGSTLERVEEAMADDDSEKDDLIAAVRKALNLQMVE